jgi:hypothetical protein
MTTGKATEQTPIILSFEEFWLWLEGHTNCIVRAGTPEAVLYDDDDLHWQLVLESGDTRVVQLLRGKTAVAELLIHPADVTYVQGELGDVEGEYIFELISESERDRVATYHFVLDHGFDQAPGAGPEEPVH